MATQRAFLASCYQGLAHKKAVFTDGALTSVVPARNWAIDSLQSYSPGAITQLTGHEGYKTAPTFTIGGCTVGTYTDPRSGQTLNYIDLDPAGTELILPYPDTWAQWCDVNTSILLSLPDTGATISVECWQGWCQAASGGFANPATQIIFANKWYNGSGVGFGAFENLTRNIDAVDGHIYYTCSPLARRRANGTADTTGIQNGAHRISAHGGASPALKRCVHHWHSLRNPIWWYAYHNTPFSNIGGWPKMADMQFNHCMRQARNPLRFGTQPTWNQGVHSTGAGGFQVIPYYTNGEMDAFFLYYKEATATYPLRIYFIASDLINLWPGQ
jgi:hypothetical protein